MQEKHVIIDVDPAIGVPLRDVDDAFAILLLLATTGITIDAVTVNFGNAPALRGYQIAKEVLSIAGSDVPVFMGAKSRHELGVSNPAVEHMIKLVNASPGKISLLAVAPLTNVATAMMLDAAFARNLRELIIMGGSLEFKPFCERGEFNFKCDAPAASVVLAAPIKKTLITMDVCSHTIFTRKHLAMLRGSSRAMAQYCAKRIPLWLLVNQIYFHGSGFYPWDPVAAAYLTDPSLFDENQCTFSLVQEGRYSGKIVGFRKHPNLSPGDSTIPINIPLQLEGERFMKMFIERILSI